MKKWVKKNLFAICSSCLAYTVMYHLGSRSYFLFGEPEFPTEE